jgi:hypothetical protein
LFGEDYDYIDNRHNPPESGILMQLGGESGEGDYERFIIKKVDIQELGSKDSITKVAKQDTKKAAKKRRVDY